MGESGMMIADIAQRHSPASISERRQWTDGLKPRASVPTTQLKRETPIEVTE